MRKTSVSETCSPHVSYNYGRVAAVLANVLLRQPGHDGPATNRPGEKQGYKKTKFIQMFLEK